MGIRSYFRVFYGIKIPLNHQDLLEAIDSETEPRMLAAQRAGMDTSYGYIVDEEDGFLYIGRDLGSLSYVDSHYLQIGMEELSALSLQVAAQLREAGLEGDPAFHIQLEMA